MERISDTSTVTTTRVWDIARIELNWQRKIISVVFVAADGAVTTQSVNGDTALQLMTSLNKADIRTNTLRQRILSRFYPTGTPVGTPD